MKTAIALSAALLLTGCGMPQNVFGEDGFFARRAAERNAETAPVSVSILSYDGLSCAELAALRAEEAALRETLADDDTARMTASTARLRQIAMAEDAASCG